MSHPAVVEAAAVGLPDELKGEQLWGYVVLAPGTDADEALRAELVDLVADAARARASGPPASGSCAASPRPAAPRCVRRVVRAVATGTDPGDLSSLEDAGALDAVREA